MRLFQNHAILVSIFSLFPKTVSELLLLTLRYLLLRNSEHQPFVFQMSSLFFWKYSVVLRFQISRNLKRISIAKIIFLSHSLSALSAISVVASCNVYLSYQFCITTLKIELTHPVSKIKSNIVGFKCLFTWVITSKLQKSRTTDCLKVLYKLFIKKKTDREKLSYKTNFLMMP